MGLKQIEKELYKAPVTSGAVEFEQNNLNLPVCEVNRKEFLEDVFGDYEGYICVFNKRSDGVPSNAFFSHNEKDRMEYYIQRRMGMNTYVSYSTYFKGKKTSKKEVLRTQKNIIHTYMLVQDLDYYKLNMSGSEVLQKVGDMVRSGEIICPNYILFTGRGYQLVWLVEPFKNIAGYTNDKDWRSVQEFLYNKLHFLNSDTVVKNPSAVTRMPDTIHNATKNKVYAFKLNEVRLSLKDFVFYYGVVPAADRSVKPKKNKNKAKKPASKGVTRIVSNWNEFTLNRYREGDILTFVKLQNERGISYIGIRNWLALVLRFHALVSSDGDKAYALDRVRELCSVMVMDETTEEEIERRSEPAERYYEEWVTDTWDKDKYVRGGLFYTNKRMLELMDIKEDYYAQWKMKTIKIKNNKYEAARKRFEKFGEENAQGHTWEAYQERRNTKLAEQREDKLWQLEQAIKRHPNAKKKELAKLLGVTDRTLRNWLKQLEK